MEEEGFNVFKFISELNVKYIYLLIFIIVIIPVLNPVGAPIKITSDTRTYYEEVNAIQPGDKVLVVWSIGYDALMELKSSMYVTMSMLIEQEAKMIHVFGHPEGPGLFPQVFGDPETGQIGTITPIMQQYEYTYGEDYMVLGYVYVNEASVNSMAQNLHNFVTNDWKGNPISGTFLDEVQDGGDFDKIIIFTAGFFSDAVIRHFSMDFDVPTLMSAIGVSIPSSKIYVDAGYVSAVLGSTRGGAELEYLANMPGPGLTAMDAFSFVHYFYMAIIILGNIAYFAYERHQRDLRRTALQ
jgi:hypothetical protein